MARADRRAAVFAVVMAAGAVACAVSVPPTGGPEDTTPPSVVATVPANESTGVDPDSRIAITFSDDMTRAKVERLVQVTPVITFDRVRWEGRSLIIYPGEPMQRDTTYLVNLKSGYRDNHGVPSKSPFEFVFATGAFLDSARIEGTVYFKREPNGKGMVRCFRLPKGDDFDPAAARPDREAAASREGTYRLSYLPSNDARFVLLAFIDTNGNGLYDAPGEPSLAFPDTVLLTAAAPVAQGIDFPIIDPNEPAVVSGTVVNETGIDSLAASVLLVALDDSTRAPQYAVCNDKGAYSFARVAAGSYLLRAFLDIQADSTCGTYPCPDGSAAPCMEPCIEAPDTLHATPGATVEVPPLIVRRKESR